MPYLGDWCIVDMLRGDRLERVAVAHADPEAQAAAYEFLERFPIAAGRGARSRARDRQRPRRS